MIITQTPLRLSFFGGGTDYPNYFRKYGGETLAASINRYTLVTVARTNDLADYAFRVQYFNMETRNNLDEIAHPSARECLRFFNVSSGVEIHYLCDLPARAGMGSSSSATVGLLHALHAFKNQIVSREKLAEEAVFVEQQMIKERVGSQDQYTCAVGGMLHLEFLADGTVRSNPVPVAADRLNELESRLMLLYTGSTRSAHEVLDEQMARTDSGENTERLRQMKSLVKEGLRVLMGGGSLTDFGSLLHEGWMLKRELSSKISMPWVDEAYEKARQKGAVGGKLLGAGGGGFLLLFAEPEIQGEIRNALNKLSPARFSFENSGSRVIFYRD